MKFFTSEECLDWCRRSKCQLSEDDTGFYPDLDGGDYEVLKDELPPDSGRKVALARYLFTAFENASEYLIWLRNWDVWPSSGHLPLFNWFQQSFGDFRTFDMTPGHLINADEADDGMSVLVTSLQFYWDCYVVPANADWIFFTSHDEYFMFLSRDADLVDKLQKDFCSAG